MKITRRQVLASLALGAGAARPNFLILLTDDQRFDTIRALFGGQALTPNLDRLASRGVAFTHACTQGGLSGAICMPSRAQLLTGRSVFRVHRGIVDRQGDPDPTLQTFPERLWAAGYETFATGKWHNGRKLFNRSFQGGSRIFFGGMSDQWKTPVFEREPSGEYPPARATFANRFSSEVFSDAAIRYLETRDRSKPFLCYVAYTSPHDPRTAPPEFAKRFPEDRVELPPNFLPEHPFDNGELRVRDELLAGFPRTPAEIRRHLAAYFAMVAEVDYQVGRVLRTLESTKDAENTYVIFAGDNGLAAGQHGLMGKQNLYDHSLRVPLLIAGPGVPKGERRETLCHLMDVCPTVCELAGVAADSGSDGRSLRGALRNPRGRVRDAVVAAYRGVQRAIRTDRHKLIRYRVNGRETTQYFDLREDRHEMRNIVEQPAEARRVAELRRELHRRLREAGDADADSWA
ncbi:MAG: sulfatase-like hydrolase/transferase [Bryobacteraceae bacterium]|nr:sulfatase-like hydrolase/transferase [Bryobacteraceae bacterium]